MKLLFALLLAPQLHAAPLHVLIDPGHGGRDNGVIRGKIREADIALSVSRKLGELLKSRNFQVTYTRTDDVAVSLNRRTEMAQEVGADLLISIHANSNKQPKVSGPEFYFQSVMPADEYAQFLANRENADQPLSASEPKAPSALDDVTHIVRDLKRNHQVKLSAHLVKALHRSWYPQGQRLSSVKQAPFYVVSQANVVSALIELGFVTNPDEAQLLASARYQNIVAERIFTALLSYKEVLDKQRMRPLH